MKLWAKNRAAGVTLGVAAAVALLCLPGAGVMVALPNLTGGPGFAAPLGALLPLLAVLSFGYSLSRRNQALERQASRHIQVADVALAALCVALVWCINGVQLTDASLAAMRNCVGYFGVFLLTVSFSGTAVASLVPLGWGICAAMGVLPQGHPVWSWPLAEVSVAESWWVAGGLGITGIVAYLTDTR